MYEQDYRDTARLSPHQRDTLTRLRIRNRTQLERARFKRYELLRNAARLHVTHPQCAEQGDRIRIRVDVESLVAGHNLPTGFTAERQVWVEVAIIDPHGHVEVISGGLDENGDLGSTNTVTKSKPGTCAPTITCSISRASSSRSPLRGRNERSSFRSTGTLLL